MGKVNETTLANIRKLDVTADKLFAVTSNQGTLAITWSGVSALDIVQLSASVIIAVYNAQTDEFKATVSYKDFYKALIALLESNEDPDGKSNNGDQTSK